MAGPDQAISALVHAYAERLDAGDLDGVASLFRHATFRSSIRPLPLTGVEEVRRMYDPVILYEGTPRTKHVITDLVVEFDDETAARARCRFSVLQSSPGKPLRVILAGRYHDQFRCIDGSWWFAERMVFPDLVGDLSSHMARP